MIATLEYQHCGCHGYSFAQDSSGAEFEEKEYKYYIESVSPYFSYSH